MLCETGAETLDFISVSLIMAIVSRERAYKKDKMMKILEAGQGEE